MRFAKAVQRVIPSTARLLLAASLVLVFWPCPAHADTIFSDLSASNPRFGTTADAASGTNTFFGQYMSEANLFTPSATYDLSQIDVALGPGGGGSNSVTVTINETLSGLALETWNLTVSSNTLYTLTPTGTLTLTSGTDYWLEVSPGDSSAEDYWFYNNTNVTGTKASNNGSSWTTQSGTLDAFDVLGTPVVPSTVPEPSTWLLLGIGLLGLALASSIKPKAVGRASA